MRVFLKNRHIVQEKRSSPVPAIGSQSALCVLVIVSESVCVFGVGVMEVLGCQR